MFFFYFWRRAEMRPMRLFFSVDSRWVTTLLFRNSLSIPCCWCDAIIHQLIVSCLKGKYSHKRSLLHILAFLIWSMNTLTTLTTRAQRAFITSFGYKSYRGKYIVSNHISDATIQMARLKLIYCHAQLVFIHHRSL